MAPSFAHTSEPAPLVGRAEVNWRYGSERSILMSEFWVPFLQDGESVLYGDARLMGDDQDNNEFNLGIGYREIVDAPVLGRGVAGVHGWFDRRITARGSTFHQATLGAEWLGEEFDILANGYIPLSDARHITVANTDAQGAQFIGTGIVIDTDSTIIEDPQAGFDIEFGWQVPFAQELTDSARIYGGGYYFEGDESENIAGWRTRLAVDVTSDIQLGGRFQRDDERGSQGFLEATVRFPFGQKKSFRDHGLYARLDDSPERDIDIVTGEKTIDQGDNVQVINNATGTAQEVLHVDNTAGAGGDGSADNPFNTLQDAVDEADAHTIIYVHAGTGDDTNQDAGVNLSKVGQQLIGSGVNLYYNTDTFSTQNGASPSSFLIARKTSAPVISDNAGDTARIDADDVVMAGVTIDGGGGSDDTLEIEGKNAFVSNVTLLNAGDDGLVVESTASNVRLLNVTVDNAGDEGFFFDNVANIVADGIVAKNSGDEGLWAFYDEGGDYTLDVKNSTFQNNDSSFRITADDVNTITATVDNITIPDTRNYGMIASFNSNSIGNLTIKNSDISNAGIEDGLWIQVNHNAELTASISNSTFNQNKDEGVAIETNDSSQIDLTMTGNTMSNNTGAVRNSGLLLYALNSSTITATVSDSVMSDNQNRGIHVYAQHAGNVNLNLTSSTITNNGDHGIRIQDESSGTAIVDLGGGTLGSTGKNRIFDNVNEELYIDTDGLQVKAENNWWGSASGLNIGTEVDPFNGSVDADPYLLTDPQ